MKELMTAAASLVLLMVFALQFVQNQVVFQHVITIDQQVEAFKEKAKQDGCITRENARALRRAISKETGCKGGEVKITGTRKKTRRGERIHYRVSVPIRNIIGSPRFWGLRNGKNQFEYVTDRYTTSEYAGRGS